MTTPNTPKQLLESKRIVVTVGCGGVGKTTVASALALAAARQGRRAVVITIDPARRLADALGLRELGNEPSPVPRSTLTTLGVPAAGSLSAMMLDMKRTFDDLVERFARDPATRDRILANRIYHHVSDALAGSAEYSAMEKVFELSERSDFDLVVVDTPPSQHALDFLEAPDRMIAFLDSRLVQLIVHPAMQAGRFGFRMFQRSAYKALELIERITGVGFLEDISEFLLAFESLAPGFRERAHQVQRRLRSEQAAFVLTTAPASESVKQSMLFLNRLAALQVPLAGIVINRMRYWPDGEPPLAVPEPEHAATALAELTQAFAALDAPDFSALEAAQAAIQAADCYAALVRRDLDTTSELVARARAVDAFVRRVPELPEDVHDLVGLGHVANHLFDTEERVEERRVAR